jgi:2-keto-4-pentenoate hydratase/2-oxohepta-3-ene-1,7-dioic acid hydratase in catechol pathway
MKLIRFGKAGKEKPAVILDDNSRRDVSAFTKDFDEYFFEDDGINKLNKWVTTNESNLPVVSSDERLGPPMAKPSKIICVGLNYSKHAAESGMQIPKEPVLFFKAPSSITGPNDDIIIPKNSKKTDWEVELAVVIGNRALYVDEFEAMNYIAGYVLHNDVSEREFQLERSGQWVKGKSADSFAPIGPFIATKDEIPEPHNLNLWLKINGEVLQSSNTSDLVFNVPFLVSYISQFMSLIPGDIISTGTPSGVGLGLKPPRYLKPGDIVELGVDGLGIAKQNVRAWSSE